MKTTDEDDARDAASPETSTPRAARPPMTPALAAELVASRFSRTMNATTSPLGVAGDPPIAAGVTAVFLVAYLAARQSDVAPMVQQVLLVLAGLPLAVAILVALALLGARGRVITWLAGLPFPVENMNAVLNGIGDGLEVTFRDRVPETPALNAKLDEIHTECFVTDAKDDLVVVRIGIVDSKRNPASSNHARYRRVLELTERVLVPLHATFPIDTVRVK